MKHQFHLAAFVICLVFIGLGFSEALLVSPLAHSEFAVVNLNHENSQILTRIARQLDPPPPPPPPYEMPASKLLRRVVRQLGPPPPPPPYEMPTFPPYTDFQMPDWQSKSFRRKREAKGGGSMPTRKGNYETIVCKHLREGPVVPLCNVTSPLAYRQERTFPVARKRNATTKLSALR